MRNNERRNLLEVIFLDGPVTKRSVRRPRRIHGFIKMVILEASDTKCLRMKCGFTVDQLTERDKLHKQSDVKGRRQAV